VAKKKKAPQKRTAAAERKFADGLRRAEDLMTRRRWAQARALLEELDKSYPQRQEVLRALIEVAVHLQDNRLYHYGCERLLEICPRDRHLPFMLTLAYAKNEWPALALSVGRRALAQDPDYEKAPEVRGLLARLEPLLQEESVRLGLEGPESLELLTLHDQVRAQSMQGRFARALASAEELIRRRPDFTPAYNNGAEAAFHAGRTAQAIDLARRLLARAPDNVFALANLVRFLCVTGQVDEARAEAERLRTLEPDDLDRTVKQAEAFAWLGDDAGVLAVCARARSLADAREPGAAALLHHLAAVAACRQGREDEARGYWRAALRAVPDFELARDNLADLDRPAGERNAPWSYTFNYYVPRQLIDGLMTFLKTADGKGPEAQRYLTAHPELEGLVPLLLDHCDGIGRELALHLVGLFRTPALLRAARDFALGQRGADKLRLRAAQLADEAMPPGPRRYWIEGTWREAALQRFEIHTDVLERSYAPGVYELLGQGVAALRAGDAASAERVLRQALAIDPDDPVVMNNLAVACAQLGRPEEGEALSLRLYERHPDYLFGRTALASLAAERGELERARELLAPLLTRKRLHVGEFHALCMAELNLFLAEGNRAQAESWLGMWREVDPDHPVLKEFARRVRALRP
jgi:tetratricopeptide (TPR) repeat protein